MSKLTFFAGKGGVGKTTLAAAYAVHRAQTGGGRVLAMSTDPAHSLADVLQLRLADKVRQVPLSRNGKPNKKTVSRKRRHQGGALFAWQVNAEKQFDKFLRAERDSILDLAAGATIFTRKELEPLLDTTLPGMAEVAALLALKDLLDDERYDEIVVDTAPLGHTLRLFSLPDHFANFLRFLETAASRDEALAEAFARKTLERSPLIDKWVRMVEDVQSALSAEQSKLILVTTPEIFALNETQRAEAWLREAAPRLTIDGLVLNRAVLRAGKCARCGRRAKATVQAEKFLRREFRGVPLMVAGDPGGPIMGAAALAEFAQHVFEGKALRMEPEPEVRETKHASGRAAPALQPADWPGLAAPLSFSVGKGGVGKTTISAALATAQRRRQPRIAVTICSTDPAPSLDDVFDAEIGNAPVAVLHDAKLKAVEIDSLAEFRQWSARIRQNINEALGAGRGRGLQVDLSFERRLLTALLDVVPPGVDEVFATFRMMDLLGDVAGEPAGATTQRRAALRVLMDMAPTGHALELLRTPARLLHWCRLLLKTLAPHRKLPLVLDLAVELAKIEQRARGLASMLGDELQSEVWAVMLAEPLPDQETARLLAALDELQAPARALFVNRVLAESDVRGCRRCGRQRAWQLVTLSKLAKRYRSRTIYCVREFPYEISGAARLKAFTRELWKI